MPTLATRKRRLFKILGTAGIACLAAAGLAAVPLTAATASAAPHDQHALVSPEVSHTGTAPTGYEVTFRYYDPTATTVQIRGEWFFSGAAGTSTATSEGLLPPQWQPGDFPIAFPNQ